VREKALSCTERAWNFGLQAYAIKRLLNRTACKFVAHLWNIEASHRIISGRGRPYLAKTRITHQRIRMDSAQKHGASGN